MRRTCSWTLGILLVGLTPRVVSQENSSGALLEMADEMLHEVRKLRGLDPKEAIQKGVKDKQEIRKYLDERVRQEYDDTELRREGRVLQKLGLIPEDMDYKEFTLQLLTEQIGGYYDPDKKILFIASWLPVEAQKPVMVHELTHALQDQHFDLSRFLKRDREAGNDDRTMAHHALFEGEGMAVMLDYMLQGMGKNFAELPNLVPLLRSQLAQADTQYEIFRLAPMYLKESLLFPYGYGAAFLQRIRAREPWAAVDRIYADLPASTEQIIHPEKYFEERDDPQEVEIPDPAIRLGKLWKTGYKNVLGEFSLYLLLKLFLSDQHAREGAAGWDGDRVIITEEEGGPGAVVTLESIWDSSQDADEFYYALELWLQRRFPGGTKKEESENKLIWTEKGENHVLRRNGSRVGLTLGVPHSVLRTLKLD